VATNRNSESEGDGVPVEFGGLNIGLILVELQQGSQETFSRVLILGAGGRHFELGKTAYKEIRKWILQSRFSSGQVDKL
jgi:hypothetical protein